MQRLVKQRQQGSGQQNLSKKLIRDMEIPLPGYEEQIRISSAIRSVDSKIQKERSYKQNLQHLKKGLMQDLLTGKVRVNA